MKKEELIEKYEYELKLLRFQFGEIFRTKVYEELLDYLKQLDEPQRLVVPQFVANYIEYAKVNEWDLLLAMNNVAYEDDKELRKWFNNNTEAFAQSWLDGYEVEKEPKYTVKIKAILGQYLERYYLNNEVLTPQFKRTQSTERDEPPTFTRKELEQANFGWVFDCTGIEIEEVE